MEPSFAEEAYPIEQWEVYRIFTTYTNPPKEKLVVIAITGAEIRGVFINSRLTEYIRSRPGLVDCTAGISVDEHPFLRYDSHVDCRKTYYFTEPELWSNIVGKLSLNGIDAVRQAVARCKVLRGYDKARILEV